MIGEISIAQLGIFLVSLLIAMSFHEAMHGFTAHWLGDTTAEEEGRLTLNPLKHIDLFMTILLPLMMIVAGLPPILAAKPVPFNPMRVKYDEFGAALIGAAGPLTNLALAVITALFMRLFGVGVGTDIFTILELFISINIGLFVFNLLPIPPLDGSRVLYAFAPEPLQRFMEQIESMGFIFIIVILVVLLPVIGPIIGNVNEFLHILLLG